MKLTTTKQQAYEIFRVYNEKFELDYNDVKTAVPELYADITFEQSNFVNNYSELERTYRVTNRSGKRFFNMPSGSRSVFGNSLDGSDFNVRLDYYNWEVEKVVLEIPDAIFSYIKFPFVENEYLKKHTSSLLTLLCEGHYIILESPDKSGKDSDK